MAAASSAPPAKAATESADPPPPVVAPSSASPIVKPLPPEWFIEHDTNAEMRWDSAADQRLATANSHFFVRSHTRTPQIDPDDYRLRLFGDGLANSLSYDEAITVSLDELKAMPRHTVTSFLECTGNGRALFEIQQKMKVPGTPWLLGGIGMATWSGVRLSSVLRDAGLRPDAVDVMATGLDDPYVTEGVDHGRVRRPIPTWKAMDDCLLAFEMNGAPLPPDHGYPLRLFVPGWVGIASIKWLGQLEVSTKRLESPWNTYWYRMSGGEYPPDSPPLTVVPVRSSFEIGWNAVFATGEQVLLSGRSWSGAAPVARVEVSLDGGLSWQTPELSAPRGQHAWSRWEVAWVPPAPGTYELLARATDRLGRTQPDTVAFNDEGYLFWAVVRHPVTVV